MRASEMPSEHESGLRAGLCLARLTHRIATNTLPIHDERVGRYVRLKWGGSNTYAFSARTSRVSLDLGVPAIGDFFDGHIEVVGEVARASVFLKHGALVLFGVVAGVGVIGTVSEMLADFTAWNIAAAVFWCAFAAKICWSFRRAAKTLAAEAVSLLSEVPSREDTAGDADGQH